MSDRYHQFANSAVGRQITSASACRSPRRCAATARATPTCGARC